ncbi:MAG TPA: beta-ketoacyl-[acyl-carrier-protein] synthase family protein [Blastocatellia bacterium]|nr:beta-ketoacyl-[acyl-carrier-protein] synthase family protein [Blastocatellia bacterium]
MPDIKVLRRVVVTGMGCLSPIGLGKEQFWNSLRDGQSGVSRITRFDASDLPVQVAAEVKDFDPDLYIPAKDRQHVSPAVAYSIAAAGMAFDDAGISPRDMDLEGKRGIGIVLGSGGASLSFVEKQYRYYFANEAKKASIYTIPTATPGSLPSEVSMAYGLKGFSHLVSTGCTSSTDAINYAAQMIALGRIDTVLTGGVDAPLAHSIVLGFCVMKVMTGSWNDEPSRASRPFSKDRDGFVLGEGAYFFVLEELNHARSRGAKIYGEIIGYGSTCDAHHRVRLDESGEEPAHAMTLALKDAGLKPEEIDYVNLHGTSTELNDRIETRAVKRAFGDAAYRIPMSATKSMVGHPQGASGAAGLTATLGAINLGFLPPTINLDEADPECDLDYVPNKSRVADVRYALCNCIGFGSKNSALVVKRFEA